MTEELKPIDVSKYTVTENGNVIRTDNKETLKNALERITELEKENAELKKLLLAYFMYVQSNRNPYYLKDVDKDKVKKLLGVEKLLM